MLKGFVLAAKKSRKDCDINSDNIIALWQPINNTIHLFNSLTYVYIYCIIFLSIYLISGYPYVPHLQLLGQFLLPIGLLGFGFPLKYHTMNNNKIFHLIWCHRYLINRTTKNVSCTIILYRQTRSAITNNTEGTKASYWCQKEHTLCFRLWIEGHLGMNRGITWGYSLDISTYNIPP